MAVLAVLYFGAPAVLYALRSFLPLALIIPIALLLVTVRIVLVVRLTKSYHAHHTRPPSATQGFWRIGVREVLIGVACGGVLIGMALGVAWVGNRWFESASSIQSFLAQFGGWPVVLIPLTLVAYDEELFYRGLGFEIMRRYGASWASVIITTTLLFACAHIPYGLTTVFNALVGGALLAYCHYRWRRIHIVAIAHAVANIGVASLWWWSQSGT